MSMGSSELMYFIIVFSPLIFINLQESRTFWWKILMHMIYKKQLAHVFNPVLGRQKCADSVSLRTVRSHSSRLARLGLGVALAVLWNSLCRTCLPRTHRSSCLWWD